MASTTKSGIILPEQALPVGYARFTGAVNRLAVIIAVAFVVGVEEREDNVGIFTTTSEDCFTVREPLDTVLQRLREAQQPQG